MDLDEAARAGFRGGEGLGAALGDEAVDGAGEAGGEGEPGGDAAVGEAFGQGDLDDGSLGEVEGDLGAAQADAAQVVAAPLAVAIGGEVAEEEGGWGVVVAVAETLAEVALRDEGCWEGRVVF